MTREEQRQVQRRLVQLRGYFPPDRWAIRKDSSPFHFPPNEVYSIWNLGEPEVESRDEVFWFCLEARPDKPVSRSGQVRWLGSVSFRRGQVSYGSAEFCRVLSALVPHLFREAEKLVRERAAAEVEDAQLTFNKAVKTSTRAMASSLECLNALVSEDTSKDSDSK